MKIFLLVAAGFAASPLAPAVRLAAPIVRAAETYAASGILKATSSDRRTLTIAHDTIPGYMGAMTMSFELGAAVKADGLAVGDRVRFTFTATEDGRRVISKIEKETSRRAP